MAQHEFISFRIPSATAGWDLDAWQILPNYRAGPHPVIIMAHGVGCNKLMGLKPFAEAFVDAGYACVIFDYRRWGKSDGTRRNSVFISEHLEDYRTVLKFIKSQESFDPHRVVLWGFSFAGGHVLTLSGENLGIAAVIAQSPYTGRPFVLVWSLVYFINLFLGFLDLLAQLFNLPPVYIPTTALPDSVGFITKPKAFDGFFSANESGSGEFPNQIAASIAFRVPLYQPKKALPKIDHPILFIAPREDNICPYASTVAASKIPRQAELVEIDGNHFDMFLGRPAFEACIQAQLDFLSQHVPL